MTNLELIHGHFDDSLSAQETEQLNHLLKTDPAAAEKFAEVARLHHALMDGFQTGSFPVKTVPEAAENKVISFPKLLMRIALPTAACIMIPVLIFTLMKPSRDTLAQDAETINGEVTASGFAALTKVVNAEWASLHPRRGDLLAQDHYTLTAGLAQIEFFSGVSVVIEGLADFEILSTDEMRLHSGKIHAQVPPPAIGFQIHTPHGTALDLGTEFALDLTSSSPELHVIDGEVEWHPNDSTETLLTTGKALSLPDNAPLDARADRFVNQTQLRDHLQAQQSHHYTAWESFSLQTQAHPALVAYLPMTSERPSSRRMTTFPNALTPGTVVAAQPAQGRWEQKPAMDFSPHGSRVRVDIPGEFQEITLSTWVRINSLDRKFNALFLTDHYEPGEPHWQILPDGRIHFSIKLESEKLHHVHLSPPVWDHAKSSQWLHLVTTYDAQTRTATHYLDGRQISTDQAPQDKPTPAIKIGSAQIGNWGLPTQQEPSFAVRNLNGLMDEFTIYSKALSATEVETLYQHGRP